MENNVSIFPKGIIFDRTNLLKPKNNANPVYDLKPDTINVYINNKPIDLKKLIEYWDKSH